MEEKRRRTKPLLAATRGGVKKQELILRGRERNDSRGKGWKSEQRKKEGGYLEGEVRVPLEGMRARVHLRLMTGVAGWSQKISVGYPPRAEPTHEEERRDDLDRE